MHKENGACTRGEISSRLRSTELRGHGDEPRPMDVTSKTNFRGFYQLLMYLVQIFYKYCWGCMLHDHARVCDFGTTYRRRWEEVWRNFLVGSNIQLDDECLWRTERIVNTALPPGHSLWKQICATPLKNGFGAALGFHEYSSWLPGTMVSMFRTQWTYKESTTQGAIWAHSTVAQNTRVTYSSRQAWLGRPSDFTAVSGGLMEVPLCRAVRHTWPCLI